MELYRIGVIEMRILPICIGALAILLTRGEAQASMCVNGRPTIEQEFDRSLDVVEGTVVSINRNFPRSFVYRGRRVIEPVDLVTVRVARSFKQQITEQFTFINTRDSAAVPVEVSGRYLLFVRQRARSGDFYIDTCGSSREISLVSNDVLERLDHRSADAGR